MSNIIRYGDDIDFGGEKFLVIDEDTLLSDLVHYHFSSKGYAIEVCRALSDVPELDLTEYSLIIIDINYDTENSLNLIRDIRANSLTKETPVIICSKTTNNNTVVSALNAGADDYISRPFAIPELVARINKLVGIV